MSATTKEESFDKYYVKFDGDEDKWHTWSLTIEGVGCKKGWWDEMLNPIPLDTKNPDDKMNIRIKKESSSLAIPSHCLWRWSGRRIHFRREQSLGLSGLEEPEDAL